MGTHAQIKKCKEFLSLNDLEFLPTKFPPPKSPILLHKRIYSKKLCRQGFGREGLEEAFELKGRFSGECWTGTSQTFPEVKMWTDDLKKIILVQSYK